jgi:hypothetical protein
VPGNNTYRYDYKIYTINAGGEPPSEIRTYITKTVNTLPQTRTQSGPFNYNRTLANTAFESFNFDSLIGGNISASNYNSSENKYSDVVSVNITAPAFQQATAQPPGFGPIRFNYTTPTTFTVKSLLTRNESSGTTSYTWTIGSSTTAGSQNSNGDIILTGRTDAVNTLFKITGKNTGVTNKFDSGNGNESEGNVPLRPANAPSLGNLIFNYGTSLTTFTVSAEIQRNELTGTTNYTWNIGGAIITGTHINDPAYAVNYINLGGRTDAVNAAVKLTAFNTGVTNKTDSAIGNEPTGNVPPRPSGGGGGTGAAPIPTFGKITFSQVNASGQYTVSCTLTQNGAGLTTNYTWTPGGPDTAVPGTTSVSLSATNASDTSFSLSGTNTGLGYSTSAPGPATNSTIYYTIGSRSGGQINITYPANALFPYLNITGAGSSFFEYTGTLAAGNTITLQPTEQHTSQSITYVSGYYT